MRVKSGTLHEADQCTAQHSGDRHYWSHHRACTEKKRESRAIAGATASVSLDSAGRRHERENWQDADRVTEREATPLGAAHRTEGNLLYCSLKIMLRWCSKNKHADQDENAHTVKNIPVK